MDSKSKKSRELVEKLSKLHALKPKEQEASIDELAGEGGLQESDENREMADQVLQESEDETNDNKTQKKNPMEVLDRLTTDEHRITDEEAIEFLIQKSVSQLWRRATRRSIPEYNSGSFFLNSIVHLGSFVGRVSNPSFDHSSINQDSLRLADSRVFFALSRGLRSSFM
ncbi:MAG: hypothetical protein SFT81_05330 [Candidatus Caenarcaniphilales bacterium]|nr:hypothetical protein [Candidatus Caenarcaniphilales bacterium]